MDWESESFGFSMLAGLIAVAVSALYIWLINWLTPWFDSMSFSPWWLLIIVAAVYLVLSVISAITAYVWDDIVLGLTFILTGIIGLPVIIATIPIWGSIWLFSYYSDRKLEHEMHLGGKAVAPYIKEFIELAKQEEKNDAALSYFEEKLWPVLGFLPREKLGELFSFLVSTDKDWALERVLWATQWYPPDDLTDTTDEDLGEHESERRFQFRNIAPQDPLIYVQRNLFNQDANLVQEAGKDATWRMISKPPELIYTHLSRLEKLETWTQEISQLVLRAHQGSEEPSALTNVCQLYTLLQNAQYLSTTDNPWGYESPSGQWPDDWMEEIYPGWSPSSTSDYYAYPPKEDQDIPIRGEIERGKSILSIATKVFGSTKQYDHSSERALTYKLLSVVYPVVFKRDILILGEQGTELFALNADELLYPATVEVLRNLIRVSDLLYRSEQAGLMITDQLAYYASALSILHSMLPVVENEINSQDRYFLRRSIDRWSDTVVKEIAKKRAKSDLVAKLIQPKSIGPLYLVEVELKNRAGGLAENVNVQFDPDGKLATSGVHARKPQVAVKYIRGSETLPIQFHLEVGRSGNFRLPFRIEYADLENPKKIIDFADEANFIGEELPFDEMYENPYIAGPPIKTDRMFFGRSGIFSYVEKHLPAGDQLNNIVLHGERRTGKTSILYQLKKRLPERYQPLFVDLQGAAGKSEDRFWYHMASSMHEELQLAGISIVKPELELFSRGDPFYYFDKNFLAELHTSLPDKIPVLLIDEFDVLDKSIKSGKLPEGVAENLRHLMQHSEKLGFIFAGTYDITKMSADYMSVLFNATRQKRIELLGWDTFKSLVEDPVKDYFKYDELAVERIWKMTSGHPFFVQLICQELVIYRNENGLVYLTIQDVDNVIEDVIDQGDIHLGYMWDGLDQEKKQFLLVVSELLELKGLAVNTDIRKSMEHYDISVDMEDAQKELTAKAILIEKNGQYHFPIGLMHKWIFATKSLETLL